MHSCNFIIKTNIIFVTFSLVLHIASFQISPIFSLAPPLLSLSVFLSVSLPILLSLAVICHYGYIPYIILFHGNQSKHWSVPFLCIPVQCVHNRFFQRIRNIDYTIYFKTFKCRFSIIILTCSLFLFQS